MKKTPVPALGHELMPAEVHQPDPAQDPGETLARQRVKQESAKGAARTSKLFRNLAAPHSVLREFLQSDATRQFDRLSRMIDRLRKR